MSKPAPRIVILGGGIIGICTAYYLLSSTEIPAGTTVTLIENTSIACGSSSKAAGFIAGDPAWHSSGNRDLAALSYEAFADLARRLDGKSTYGWRECTATGVKIGQGQDQLSSYRQLPQGSIEEAKPGHPPAWTRGERQDVSGNGKLAQIEPGLFCKRLHAECTKLGLRTLIAQPLRRSDHIINTSEGDIPYDRLVLAAGPWSADLCQTLKLPVVPVTNLPGHSIVLKPGPLPVGYNDVPAEVLMCGIGATQEQQEAVDLPDAHGLTVGPQSIRAGPQELNEWELNHGWTRTVEFFPRPDGTIAAAGENSVPSANGNELFENRKNRFPMTGRNVSTLIDRKLVSRMLRSAKAVSPSLDVEQGARLVRADLCYRPVTEDKQPIIGRWYQDVFVSSGHGPWGITLAPGSGIVMAELLIADIKGVEPKLSANINGLSPFRNFGRSSKL